MYHVSAQGVDERTINVHYYYYYDPGASLSGTGTSCPYAYLRYTGIDGCV